MICCLSCVLLSSVEWMCCFVVFFFQAEDGIRDLVRSRGLGDVYKRQASISAQPAGWRQRCFAELREAGSGQEYGGCQPHSCLLYTSDAADERSSVDLGGRRIIKKKTAHTIGNGCTCQHQRMNTLQVQKINDKARW